MNHIARIATTATLSLVSVLGCAQPATSPPRVLTFVSVGDSVASGEGNPQTPADVIPNSKYSPLKQIPNSNYSPFKQKPNPKYHPAKDLPNVHYNPFRDVINPGYQPFPIPSALAELLPWFPPYDPNLTIRNQDHDNRLTVPNPDYDPNALVDNLDYDSRIMIENPGYDTNVWIVQTPPVWLEPTNAHRSDWAGPALAAASLQASHPEVQIRFLHLAESGANIENVVAQIQAATRHETVESAGSHIDVLSISVGANDLYPGGFSKLITDCLHAVRPSQNPELNDSIEQQLKTLPARFDQLAEVITTNDIAQVFITEYFDPTRNRDGEFAFGEMEWAYHAIVVPLNDAVRAAAAKHNWQYVGGIAEQFRQHGYFAERLLDPRRQIPNPTYDPIERKPNPAYNPVEELPNLKYNPIRNKPNPKYNPVENKPNLKYQPFKWFANYDPRWTVPNPEYNAALTVPNAAYDPRLSVLNPDYDPEPLVANPAYDPEFLIPNPDYEAGLVSGENWVVRVEESVRDQGDFSGTAHPNGRGQAVYRDRLVEEIRRWVLDYTWPAPSLIQLEVSDRTVRLLLASQYPLARLEVQSAEALSTRRWTTVDCDLTLLESGLCEARIQDEVAGSRFYRIRVQ